MQSYQSLPARSPLVEMTLNRTILIPLVVKRAMDIKLYKPGRFAYLMEKPFAKELWAYLTADKRIKLMLSATEEGKPAIQFFLTELESQFEEHLTSLEYPEEEISVLVNNMIKQILELKGYEHLACGICRNGRYFKSSGLYTRKTGIGNQ